MSDAYKLLTPTVIADLAGSAVADGRLATNALIRFLYRVAEAHPNHPSRLEITEAMTFLSQANSEKP